MKIITRITKTKAGKYAYNGRLFEYFIDARRAMTQDRNRQAQASVHCNAKSKSRFASLTSQREPIA